MVKTSLFVFFFLIPTLAIAAVKKFIDFDLIFFAQAQKIERGAQFYPYPSLLAGPGITFGGKVKVMGPSVEWIEGNRDTDYFFQLGARLIRDGRPFLRFENKFREKEDYRASRADSFEVYGKTKRRFGFKNLFEVGVELAREVNRHKGKYGNIFVKSPAGIKFLSARGLLGGGDSRHNKYFYGPESKSGLSHFDFSLEYAFKKPYWGDLLLLRGQSSWVLQSENRQADLVRRRDHQLNAGFVWIWLL